MTFNPLTLKPMNTEPNLSSPLSSEAIASTEMKLALGDDDLNDEPLPKRQEDAMQIIECAGGCS